MSQWVGYAVSVSCGSPLGCYQGTILEADGVTITLTKPFRNGFPYPKSQVTLNASDIKELNIISARASPPAASTVALPRAARARATVCEALQAGPGLPDPPLVVPAAGKPARSKPIDIQGTANRHKNNSNTAGSFGQGGSSTPRSRGGNGGNGSGGGNGGGNGSGGNTNSERARRRNEACFGSAAADAEIEGEFDFEKNLALFDKQALWQQMRSTKPDLVRQTEGAGGKFRHDESVLSGNPAAAAIAARRPVTVPPQASGALLYVTDEGVEIPSVSRWVRRALWAALRAAGLQQDCSLLLARAASDVALRLVGGGRRLEHTNAHQPPALALLLGRHSIGACGLTVGRLMCSHGARVTALHATRDHDATGGDAWCRAKHAAEQCGVTFVASPADLPAADLVLLATHDPFDGPDDDGEELQSDDRLRAALSWARSARGALVALEPPARGYPRIELRATICALLPPAGCPALGRLHLANVSPPPQVFSALGLQYRPPFGAWTALPLHPQHDP